MELMIAGIILFFGMHLISTTFIRGNLIAALGQQPYLGLYSAVSAVGLGLLIYGYSQFNLLENSWLWTPFPFGKMAAHALMPLAFILLLSAYLPGKIRVVTKHPMMIATLLWSASHLLANGDLASTMIFGSFFIYGVLAIALHKPRTTTLDTYAPAIIANKKKGKIVFDIVAVIVGLGIHALVMLNHQSLFGVPVTG